MRARCVLAGRLESGNLAAAMPDVASRLLGEPNRRLSSRRDWRYGSKGSLSINPESGVWHDHEAGEGGGVLDLVRRALKCSTAEALRWIDSDNVAVAAALPRREAKPKRDNRPQAMQIWSESTNPAGTLAERYLGNRGLRLPDDPLRVIRFHPACPFGADKLPCMVALMRDPLTDEPTGIHRTAISPEGTRLDRKMLGHAGAIKLTDDADVTTGLGVAEGIETALSIMQWWGWVPLWALGSAGAIAAMPVLRGIECLTVFADRDDSGRGEQAAAECIVRWADACPETFIQVPPIPGDFNDMQVA